MCVSLRQRESEGQASVASVRSQRVRRSLIVALFGVALHALCLRYNPVEEMATLANYKNFRFFTTARDTADTPQFDLSAKPQACDAEPCDKWLTADQATTVVPGVSGQAGVPNTFLANFSAVCFLTVRDIARMHTGNRPVALIQSAWGGTRVEAWMSTEAIAKAAPSAGATPPVKTGPNAASVLYNAMVSPWNKFAVRAAFWYQVSSSMGVVVVVVVV